MDLGNRRVGTPRTGVVAGSVWESRMKVDEVKGGIKVFNGDENPDEENGENGSGVQVYKRMRPKQGLVGISGKRKTWKTEVSEGSDKNPIQIARQKSELSKNLDEECKELGVYVDGVKKSPVKIARQRSEWSKNLDEQCKELSLSADGIKKSPIQKKKTRSEVNRELNLSVDGMERSPVQNLKKISVSLKGLSDSSDGERISAQLRKVKSELASNEASDGIESNDELRKAKSSDGKSSILVMKAESVSKLVFDESSDHLSSLSETTERKSIQLRKANFESNGVLEENPTGITKTGSDEHLEEVENCEEKIMTSNSPPKLQLTYKGDKDSGENFWDGESEEENDEIETENKSFDVKEISIPEEKPKKIVIEEKKIQQKYIRSVPISPIVKRQLPPVNNNPRIVQKPTKTKPIADEFQKVPKKHSKLQSFVDLVMWRDASKSAFIFGLGTFIIVSSSYTKDYNISVISVLSYLGLVYLAAIFISRSIIYRGAIDAEDTIQEHVIGEEEAIWLLKMLLPYINEFLLKLRALFSGDPATTMKLAVLLFVLARCGSSITIWKMVKLGFFGVFTVPKICSSYSSQLTAYGTFWIRRFRDAWGTCSHKKGVAFFIFTVVWNLSSVVARIWAVFMLYVAFRYYQQQKSNYEDLVEEEARGGVGEGSVAEVKIGGQRRQGRAQL